MLTKEFLDLFEKTQKKLEKGYLQNGEEFNKIKYFYSFTESSIEDDDYIVQVKDKEEFLENLQTLFKLRKQFYKHNSSVFFDDESSFDEHNLAFVFHRATIEDFNNPLTFLKREIEFLKHHFNQTRKCIGTFQNDKLGEVEIYSTISSNSLAFESNYCLELSLKKKGQAKFYNLPLVHFDIDEKSAYIKGIQNKTYFKDNSDSWFKNVNRYLYKVNNGIDVEKSLDNSVQSISDVSPSHLIALTIATKYFNDQGIKDFYFPIMCPLKYMNEIYALNTRTLNEYELSKKYYTSRGLNPETDKEIYEKQLEENQKKVDQIQSNLTDRLAFTALRLEHHLPFMSVVNLGDDSLGYTHLKTKNVDYLKNDHELVKIYKCVNNKQKTYEDDYMTK